MLEIFLEIRGSSYVVCGTGTDRHGREYQNTVSEMAIGASNIQENTDKRRRITI